MNIDAIITEKIQDQSVIAVNNVLLHKIKPIITDLFENEISRKVADLVSDDLPSMVEATLDEVVESHVDCKVTEAVDNYMESVDWADHIDSSTIADTISDEMNNMDWDDLVTDAVKERTDQKLYELVNDAVSDLDMYNIISEIRVENAVGTVLYGSSVLENSINTAVEAYMEKNLSNFFRSPEGTALLGQYFSSHAGRCTLAANLTKLLETNDNA
jgi:uncharacterized membrane protein YheB (UPF0754 family)